MQKYILIIIIFYSTITQLFSQIQKGTKMVGGGLALIGTKATGYNNVTEEEESYNYTVATFKPTLGVMVSENLMLGSSADFSYSKLDYVTQTSIGIGPFARYFYQIKDKFYLFGDVSVGFGSTNYKYNYSSFPSDDIKTSFTAFAIGPGINYFLADNVAIEASFIIKSTKNKDELKSIGTNTLGIGLQFYF